VGHEGGERDDGGIGVDVDENVPKKKEKKKEGKGKKKGPRIHKRDNQKREEFEEEQKSQMASRTMKILTFDDVVESVVDIDDAVVGVDVATGVKEKRRDFQQRGKERNDCFQRLGDEGEKKEKEKKEKEMKRAIADSIPREEPLFRSFSLRIHNRGKYVVEGKEKRKEKNEPKGGEDGESCLR